MSECSACIVDEEEGKRLMKMEWGKNGRNGRVMEKGDGKEEWKKNGATGRWGQAERNNRIGKGNRWHTRGGWSEGLRRLFRSLAHWSQYKKFLWLTIWQDEVPAARHLFCYMSDLASRLAFVLSVSHPWYLHWWMKTVLWFVYTCLLMIYKVFPNLINKLILNVS